MITELEILQKARGLLHTPVSRFVCVSISIAAEELGLKYGGTKADKLRKEVLEFLDGSDSVSEWLDLDNYSSIVKQYQLAILDTIIARRVNKEK